MVVRIVKMTFKTECIQEFQTLFERYKNEIANQPGCHKLSLLQDIQQSNIFMTYSWWEQESDLNNYRYSETFGVVWPATKKLFAAKPEAWSLEESVKVK